MGIKELRRERVKNPNDPTRKHSLSHKVVKFMRQGEDRMDQWLSSREIDIVVIPPIKISKNKLTVAKLRKNRYN